MRRRIVKFIVVVQLVMFATHWLLYETWNFSPSGTPAYSPAYLSAVLAFLSVSFVIASSLAFRYSNAAVRWLYRASAAWMGILSFLFLATGAAWIIFSIAQIGHIAIDFHAMVRILYGVGAAAGVCGIVNASLTRTTRARIELTNLPEAWKGRRAALISDVHLGHVRNGRFLKRMVAKILNEKPDAIFIAGDLYDGTAIDAHSAAAPLNRLTAPFGVYFVAGNHEQFRDDSKFLNAVAAAGVRVLKNEKVELDGLQLVGVPFNSATQDRHLADVLEEVGLDRERASILLTHAPDWPQVAEKAGISLQLSGHTHLGQFIPWTWFARRMYRQFVYGLSRIGAMQVFTSSGAGTWGPPVRLGSNPEIVMLEFV